MIKIGNERKRASRKKVLTKGSWESIISNVVAREAPSRRKARGVRSERQRAILENDIEKNEKRQSDSEMSETRMDRLAPIQTIRIEQKSLILAQDERWRRA